MKSSLQTYKVGAVIAKGNYIIACGRNRAFKCEPRVKDYRTVHAELDCIFKRRAALHNATIYVVVLTQRRHDGVSRPCEKCRNQLRAHGLKTIVYSNRGQVVIERLR